MKEKMRNSGIEIIGDVPWGTHFCQFYKTKGDLMELLVPYLEAGLKNNELCIWITSQPSDVEEAKEALRKAAPHIDIYLEKGQIEIIPYSGGDFNEDISGSERVLNGWIKKLNQALADGYDGLRLIENICWLEKECCKDFADYEEAVDRIIGELPIIALCTYFLDGFSATEIIDVIINHQFALIKKEGKWERIENSRRKKTEDKIQVLASLVESSDDAIITKSLDGIITSWNRGAERTYGYSAKEVLGKPISILEPPALAEETKELTELIKQEDRIHHYETLRLRKDGKKINVSLTLSPILDASGNPMAALVIGRDITKSKKVEEKLRRSEQKYRIVTEQTGQVIYDYDYRTDKFSWAGAVEEVTGYSFEEFRKLGKDVWIKNIQPLNMNCADANFQNIRQTGARYKEELRLKRKDGTYICIENRGICLTDHEGRPYGAIGVLKDITDWKLAIKNIEDSERKYRSFIQNFHGIVFQLDENFVPVFMDGAVEEITGYSEKEFMSRIKWECIVIPDDLSLFLKEEERIRESSFTGYVNIEYRIKHRDGRIRWVNGIYQKISRGNGKPDFYQGSIYDITERKETDTFLESIEVARKQEIHHRIKNNLQVISSLLDLQAEQFRDKECIKDSEVLEAFRESQNRVISMALIHEELHKGGKLDTLDFSQYIEELADNLFQTYSLSSKNIRLCMNVEEKAFLNMDTAVPLGIIVNELVSNSLKYGFAEDKEGEIQILLCREERNNDINKSLFNLTISDNGKGIPENIELGNVESLGLQLVSILVDQLDGEIELKREHGTEFRITFEIVEGS